MSYFGRYIYNYQILEKDITEINIICDTYPIAFIKNVGTISECEKKNRKSENEIPSTGIYRSQGI